MKIVLAYIAIASFILVGCTTNENEKKIVGNWSGLQWLVNGQPSNFDVQSTHFGFDGKGGYTYEYLGNKEKGTYKVENDMLFTTPDKEQEMMVKIAKLTADTLVFDMNRSGQSEMLTLIRK